jgi:hypothetical protein
MKHTVEERRSGGIGQQALFSAIHHCSDQLQVSDSQRLGVFITNARWKHNQGTRGILQIRSEKKDGLRINDVTRKKDKK